MVTADHNVTREVALAVGALLDHDFVIVLGLLELKDFGGISEKSMWNFEAIFSLF
jgi:hypothetical protein